MFKQKNKQRNVMILNVDDPFNNALFFSFVHANHNVFCTYSNDSTKEKIEEKTSSLPISLENFTLFKVESDEDYNVFFNSLDEQSVSIDSIFFHPNLYDFGTITTIDNSQHLNSLKDYTFFFQLLEATTLPIFSPSTSFFFFYNKNLMHAPGFKLNLSNFNYLRNLIHNSSLNDKFNFIFFNHSFTHKNFWTEKYNSIPHEQENNQSTTDLNISYFYNSTPLHTKLDHRLMNRILDLSENNLLFRKNFSFVPLKDYFYFLKIKFKFDYSHSFYKAKKKILSFKSKKKNKVH